MYIERPWRRKIVEPKQPGRVFVRTPEEQDKALKLIFDELKIDPIRKGQTVNSDIDLEVFGHLPEPILVRLQFAADVAAQLLKRPAFDDHFIDHNERREFRERNKAEFGSAFSDKFENNLFRPNLWTGLISCFMQVKEMLRKDRKRESSHVYGEAVDVPRSAEVMALIDDFLGFIGHPTLLKGKYQDLPLTRESVQEGTTTTGLTKLDYVDKVTDTARKFLEITTNKAIPDESKIVKLAA